MMPTSFTVFRLGVCIALTGTAGAFLSAQSISPERLILAVPAGAGAEFARITAAQTLARRPEATTNDFERLGWAWVSRARMAQDDGAYRLALATADAMDAHFGPSSSALLLRGHALHNLHRFAAAEDVAHRLVAERGEARDYALLSDVLMERGKIAEAVAATQEFVNRQPGLESFARIAHLRWLCGDTPGAIQAMTRALQAADPREVETKAWTLTRLAQLHLFAGEPAKAVTTAEAALARQPGYAPALLARGRALLALDQVTAALPVLQAAVAATPLPEYRWSLADALRLTGDVVGAEAVENMIVVQGPQTDPRTTALFLATRGIEPDEAVRLATTELSQRADVHTHDAAAWALFRAGQTTEAAKESDAALREGTNDPRLLLHAALIASASGDEARAAALLQRARPLAAALTPGERTLLASSLSPSASTTASTAAIDRGITK